MSSIDRSVRILLADLNGPFGPLRSYAEMLPALSDLDVTVTVTVPSSRRHEIGDMLGGEVVETVPDSSLLAWGCSFVRLAWLNRRDFDVIHANSTSAVWGAAIAALLTRRRLVVHLRNSALSQRERRLLGLVRRLPVRKRFIAVSRAAAEVAGFEERRSTVIADPVTVSSVRSRRGLGDRVRVGAVTNQTSTKGFDIVVQVASLTKDLPLAFEVFGSTGIDPAANPFIADQFDFIARNELQNLFTFRGVVDDLRDHLPELDVMMITSRRESFSRVAAESLLTGLPLVAPAIPGLLDTIDEGRCAAVYVSGDAESAATALRSVVIDYDDSLRRSERARAWAEERFSPEGVAKAVARVYRELLRSTRT